MNPYYFYIWRERYPVATMTEFYEGRCQLVEMAKILLATKFVVWFYPFSLFRPSHKLFVNSKNHLFNKLISENVKKINLINSQKFIWMFLLRTFGEVQFWPFVAFGSGHCTNWFYFARNIPEGQQKGNEIGRKEWKWKEKVGQCQLALFSRCHNEWRKHKIGGNGTTYL